MSHLFMRPFVVAAFVLGISTSTVASAADAPAAADGGGAANAHKEEKPLPRVSVVAWQDTSLFGDAAWLGQAGPDLVAAQLSAQDTMVVLEREAVDALEQEQALTATTSAAAASANYVVGGSFHVVNDQVQIHIRIAQAGATLWAGDQAGALGDYASLCRAAARECAAWFAHKSGMPAGDTESVMGPPLSAAAAFYRGRLLMKNGDKEHAVADFLRAVKQAPDFAPAWNDLGLALEACGHPGAATAAYLQAASCDPDDPEAPRMLWTVAERMKLIHLDISIACYRRLATSYPLAIAHRTDGGHDPNPKSYRELALDRLNALHMDVDGTAPMPLPAPPLRTAPLPPLPQGRR